MLLNRGWRVMASSIYFFILDYFWYNLYNELYRRNIGFTEFKRMIYKGGSGSEEKDNIHNMYYLFGVFMF